VRCIRRHGGLHAEMRRDYGRTAIGICWRKIPGSHSPLRSRLRLRCVLKRASAGHGPYADGSENRVEFRQSGRGRGDENGIQRDTPRERLASAGRAIGIHWLADRAHGRAGGRCRRLEAPSRPNDTKSAVRGVRLCGIAWREDFTFELGMLPSRLHWPSSPAQPRSREFPDLYIAADKACNRCRDWRAAADGCPSLEPGPCA